MEFTEATAEVAALVRAELRYQNRGQAVLVPVLGMSQAAVSRRLHGHVPFDVAELLAVARLLGKPVTAFLPASACVAAPAAVPA